MQDPAHIKNIVDNLVIKISLRGLFKRREEVISKYIGDESMLRAEKELKAVLFEGGE